MKSNRMFLWIVIGITVFVQACKQHGLQLYDQSESGTSIYFPEAIGARNVIVKEVSFGYAGYSLRDSVLAIPVAITGIPSSIDRSFRLTVSGSTTAKENTHYNFMREPMIRAGRVVDTILLKINRTPDMASTQYGIDFFLEPNEYFMTRLVDTSILYLKYRVLLDDIAGISHLWTTSPRATAVLSYFGTYSRRKVDLMIEVLQLSPNFFYDSGATAPTVAQVLSYSRYMFYWLNKEAEEGRIYLDENGQVISMGQFAS